MGHPQGLGLHDFRKIAGKNCGPDQWHKDSLAGHGLCNSADPGGALAQPTGWNRFDIVSLGMEASPMPTLMDLRSRITGARPLNATVNTEEAIIADRRSRLRPAQIVEQKLRSLLGRSQLSREEQAAARQPHP
jgi:hypothetical protein